MHVGRRLLITCALFAAVLTFMTSLSTPSYAVGDIHIIVVRSTTDPALSNVTSIDRVVDLDYPSGFSHPLDPGYFILGTFGVFARPSNPQLASEVTFATHLVLEGADAEPRNVAKVCREVSQKAGPDDAILVLAQCRAAMLPSSSGESRCVLFPMATSDDPDDRGVGLPRGTILKNLNVKPHRLVALFTETCEGPTHSGKEPFGYSYTERIREKRLIPLPKKTPYLIKFLQTARGELNFGNHHPIYRDDLEVQRSRKVGGLIDTGSYLESEVNPDDFYKLQKIYYEYHKVLSLELEEGFELPDWDSESGHPWGLFRYDGDKITAPEPAPFATADEGYKFLAVRRTMLVESGEFEVREFTPNDSNESDESDDDDDSDFVPAPNERSAQPTSDDDDFVPAHGGSTF